MHVIDVQNGHLDFILRFAIFVRKRELCASALGSFNDWTTYEQGQAVCEFVSLCKGRMSLAVLVKVDEDRNQ